MASRPWLPACLALGVALWRIGTPSFSGDEAASLSAARRSAPQLWHMLGSTDAVHGAYYVLLWMVARLAGTGESAARLPSALAVAGAAAGITAIGRRLASRRAGLAAGTAFAVFPVASKYAQDARSYAFVIALAVLASYLFVRAGQAPARRRWLAAYALALTALGWANLMALLIIPAHAVTLAASRARRVAGWLAAAAVAVAGVSPLLLAAWRQRQETARFLELTTPATLTHVPGRLTESLPVLAVAATVVVTGLVTGLVTGSRAVARLAALCLPWLLVPPAILLGAGVAWPVFDSRYIVFCTPALALLTGAGLDIAAARAARLPGAGPAASGVALVTGLALIAAIGLPAQFRLRAPAGHLQNARLIAQVLAARKRPGDAVLYYPPWWLLFASAYPAGFAGLCDPGLAQSPVLAGNLTGTPVPVSRQRAALAASSRIWLIGEGRFKPDPALAGGGWHAVRIWHGGLAYLVLYQRSGVRQDRAGPTGQGRAEPAGRVRSGCRAERERAACPHASPGPGPLGSRGPPRPGRGPVAVARASGWPMDHRQLSGRPRCGW